MEMSAKSGVSFTFSGSLCILCNHLLAADKSSPGKTQFISQTMLLARHLLGYVKARIEADPTLSLVTAVRAAESDRREFFRREKNLTNLHEICSGAGLGTTKRKRSGGVDNAEAKQESDDDAGASDL
jgi:hypothetical protein